MLFDVMLSRHVYITGGSISFHKSDSKKIDTIIENYIMRTDEFNNIIEDEINPNQTFGLSLQQIEMISGTKTNSTGLFKKGSTSLTQETVYRINDITIFETSIGDTLELSKNVIGSDLQGRIVGAILSIAREVSGTLSIVYSSRDSISVISNCLKQNGNLTQLNLASPPSVERVKLNALLMDSGSILPAEYKVIESILSTTLSIGEYMNNNPGLIKNIKYNGGMKQAHDLVVKHIKNAFLDGDITKGQFRNLISQLSILLNTYAINNQELEELCLIMDT